MKKRILLASAVLFTTFAMAQKKELKAAEKALEGGNVTEAKATLDALSNVDGFEDKYKAQYYFLMGKAYADMGKKGMETIDSYTQSAEYFNNLIEFEKGYKDKYTEEAMQIMEANSGDLVNAAVADNQNKEFGKGADKLYLAYKLSGNDDYLYYAASGAVNAGAYEKALPWYVELKDKGYTGVTTQYLATNKETGEDEAFGSKNQMDLMVKSGAYENPREEETENRFPEIVKNIALIYNQQGEKEKAIAAIREAQAENPDDVNLLLTEANLYIQLDQKDKFKETMERAIAMDPENPVLFYNMGVISAEQGDNQKAMEYYQRSLDLDPTSENTYLNMASTILNQEKVLVEEMNGLGNSAADNKRYDELKKERENLYKEAVPFLEKLLEINPKNVDATRTLMNIYGNLGETASYKAMRDKLAELEQ
ncbi:tetratricopeptide repeat protein [Robertkochia sediminum]|uniref:tetratricopeptide repeat protein n=1 Tax=Robertkochia sediminum TaxID=2785326 RepID=UPI001932C489|nr:tetratricopeptide repeat protein [Robertkochia sediminum]MBL7474119.1 tetratricopeptide repeat protein [Robertkochia sediminum]